MARVCAFLFTVWQRSPLINLGLVTINERIMKNVIYYSVLIIQCAIIHVLFGTIMIAIGAIQGPFPSPLLALGVTVLIPEYWLISIGITLFTRDLWARIILRKSKKHSKVVSTILVSIGFIMIVASILITTFQNSEKDKTTQTVASKKIEVYENKIPSQKEEASISNGDLVLTRMVSDFSTDLKMEFEKTKKDIPVKIDEFTTLKDIKLSESTYTFIYCWEINKNDLTENDWKEILEDFVEDRKIELYYEVVTACAMEEVDPNEFFKTVNIKFEYTFSDINNNHIGTCGFEYKDLAKE